MQLSTIENNGESSQRMKAVHVHQFGGLESLQYEDAPRPTPGEGQVLIRVKAAGVGNWDALVRQGASALGQSLPLTPGAEFSGIVGEVGPAVVGFRPGDAVFGATNSQFTGAYAEYAVAEAGMIAPKPPSLTDVEAASLPIVAITAWQALFDYGGVDAAKRVLVQGAAGNVGAYAVQLAKRAGAIVYAVTKSRDIDFVRALGADHVMDAETMRFESEAHNIDMVLDTVGGVTLARSFAVLKPGGVLVSVVTPPDSDEAARRGVRGVFLIVRVTTEGLSEIAHLCEKGVLKTHVGEVLPLSEARRAHEMLAGLPHKGGKIVLTVDPEPVAPATADPERRDYAAISEADILRQNYHSVIVALYPDGPTAREVAERLVQSGVPTSEIAILVSEGKFRESLEKGVSFIPDAAFSGVKREGVVKGSIWGGLGGLAFGAEAALLGAEVAFALPLIGAGILVGIAFGATLDATFRDMDLSAEASGYATHLNHGGAVLTVHAKEGKVADSAEAILREARPSEIRRHPLAP